jgi:hypothetical protein
LSTLVTAGWWWISSPGANSEVEAGAVLMEETSDRSPRNVVVVGSGRSGTSLVAGLIATAGHHMGGHLVRANEANPKGFFEDYRTLLVNEALLAPYTTVLPVPRFSRAQIYPEPLVEFQRWLAVLGPEVTVGPQPHLERRMRSTLTRSPWCRKDPRFCYTLPAWEPLFGDAVRVCVFREPSRTANSMVKVAARQRVTLSFDGAVEIWAACYLHVLRHHQHRGEWVFVHYDQVLDGTGIPRLEQAIGAGGLDTSVADSALRRSPDTGQWPPAVHEIYAELCDVAGFDLN